LLFKFNVLYEPLHVDALKKHQFNFLRFVFSKQRAEYTVGAVLQLLNPVDP
jgi:hypothetical protein